MKIAYDAKRAFHNFTGLGNYSRNLLDGLVKYAPDHDYVLYTPSFDDKRAIEWAKKYPQLHIRKPKGIFGKICPSAWRSLFLTKVLEKNKPDIFHGLSHELPPNIEKLGVKTVVTIHDLIFMRYPQYFTRIDCKIYEKKFRYACQVADVVLAICEQTKRDVVEFFDIPEEKVKVVYQSCSPIYYEALPTKELERVRRKYFLPFKYLLYVGSLIERKNLLNLLEAVALTLKVSDVPLVIVGEGAAYKKRLKAKADKLGISHKIIFLPKVPTGDLPALYQASTLFIYPSFFEGFGIPLVEAMNSGTPVITSKGSCFPEVGGDAALYVDPQDPQSIADGIVSVLENPTLREEMIRKGKIYVQKFHQEKTTQALIELYKQVVQ